MRSEIQSMLVDLIDDENGKHFLDIPYALDAILSLIESKLPKELTDGREKDQEYQYGYNTALADIKKQLEIG